MAIYFEQTNRLIIPRWRKFSPRVITGEHKLLFPKDNTHAVTTMAKTLDKKVKEWNINGTLGEAWELVHSAYVNREFEVAREAAIYLKQHTANLSLILRKIIKEILIDNTANEQQEKITVVPVLSLFESTKREIASIKRKISLYLRNEFLWLELARLYSITGEVNKAEKCVNIAIHFSNNQNKYFLRSVSRFFYHIGRYDEAQNIIRRSPYLKSDPWLLSVDISYANKMGRHAVNAKRGFEILDSNNYSSESISELAGVLGTMEFKNDSFRKARKLTRQSLLSPNDNSLAQAEWIAHEINDISIEPWLDTISFGYEARAFEYLHKGNYGECLNEALLWVMDQPFSKRACHFVSYLCTGLSENYGTAIEVGELGAKTNWNYFPIINNLIFAYISDNNLYKAQELLPHLAQLVSDPRQKCFALATTGYYYYRSKDIIAGKEYYQKAIEVATKHNFQGLKRLAEANHLRESYYSGELPYPVAVSALERLLKDGKEYDLEEQLKHIIAAVKKKYEKA